MATNYKNKAVLGKPVYVGSNTASDLPLDARTRIDTITDISKVEFPYIGMIFYVVDEDAYYKVKTLKGEEKVPGVAATFIDNFKIDTYEPFSGGSGGGGLSPQEKIKIEKLIKAVGEEKTEARDNRYTAVEPDTTGSLTVVADDIEDDNFDSKTMIKKADANQYGGAFSEGDTVIFEPAEADKPGTGLTGRVEEIEKTLKNFNPDKPDKEEDTSDLLKALIAKVGLYGDETGKEVTVPEHYEADPAGEFTVVADDADPFDETTQVRQKVANALGDNFQVNDKVKKVSASTLGAPTGICEKLEIILKAIGKKSEKKEQTVPGKYVESADGTGLEVVADDYEKDATYKVEGQAGEEGVLEVVADGTDPLGENQIEVSKAVLTVGGNATVGQFVKLDVPATVLDPNTQIKKSDAVSVDGNTFDEGKHIKPATEEVVIPGTGLEGAVEGLQNKFGEHGTLTDVPAHYEETNKPSGLLVVDDNIEADKFDSNTMVKKADAGDFNIGDKVQLVELHKELQDGTGLAGELDDIHNEIGERSEIVEKGGYRPFDTAKDDTLKALKVIADGVDPSEGEINISDVKNGLKPGVNPDDITADSKVILDEDVKKPASGIMRDVEDLEENDAKQDNTLDNHEERIATIEDALVAVAPVLTPELAVETLHKIGEKIPTGTTLMTVKATGSKELPTEVTVTGCTVTNDGNGSLKSHFVA